MKEKGARFEGDCPPIDELEALEDDLLYLFLAGPGYGEGLALALPGRGWLLLDSCRVLLQGARRGLPQHSLWEQLERGDGDRVEWMLLTHPHEDHAQGFADLLEELEPRHLGVFPCPEGLDCGKGELRSVLHDAERAPAERLALAREVRSALEAIASWEEGPPRRRREFLAEGDPLAFPDSPVEVQVVGPASSGLPALPTVGRLDLNELSLALTVRYGRTLLLLGGDLPWKRSSGALSPTGWAAVFESRRELAEAPFHGLKLPHHASAAALHPDLLAPCPPGAETLATPFVIQHLPRSEALERILEARGSLRLTSLPAARNAGRAPEGPRWKLDDYRRWDEDRRGDGRRVELSREVWRDEAAPVWAVAFDADGRRCGCWRGEAALVLDGTPQAGQRAAASR